MDKLTKSQQAPLLGLDPWTLLRLRQTHEPLDYTTSLVVIYETYNVASHSNLNV